MRRERAGLTRDELERRPRKRKRGTRWSTRRCGRGLRAEIVCKMRKGVKGSTRK